MTTSEKAERSAVVQFPPASFASSPEEIERWGRYNGLRQLAGQVFLDRNAGGFKKLGKSGSWLHDKTSQRIKDDTRPHLRQAIHWVRLSRDALAAGNIAHHEHMRDVARMHMAQAGASRKQLFMEERRDAVVNLNKGPRAAAAKNAARGDASYEAVKVAFDHLQPSQQGAAATSLIGRALADTPTPLKDDQIRKHLKTIRAKIGQKPD